jgi:hypothetical protein
MQLGLLLWAWMLYTQGGLGRLIGLREDILRRYFYRFVIPNVASLIK